MLRTLILLFLGPIGWLLLILDAVQTAIEGERGSLVEVVGIDTNEDYDLSVYNNISGQNGIWD